MLCVSVYYTHTYFLPNLHTLDRIVPMYSFYKILNEGMGEQVLHVVLYVYHTLSENIHK